MDHSSKLTFLERIFKKSYYSSSNSEALFYCPFCRHYKRKLSINLDTDLWHCWICENAGKNLIYLLRKFGTERDVQDYVNYYKAKTVQGNSLTDRDLQVFRVSLPPEFTPLVGCRDSFVGHKKINYLHKRGITDLDILRYKIGTAMSGEYRDTVIFPSFDRNGEVNFFTARKIDGSYWSPKTPKGYKNQIILNEVNIDWNKPVIITEGFVDMIKADGNVAPLFGSVLSEDSKLFKSIVKNNCDVYLALDSDAQKKASVIAEKLMHSAIAVYNVNVRPFKDVGEMSKKEFDFRLQDAKIFTEEDIFKNKVRYVW